MQSDINKQHVFHGSIITCDQKNTVAEYLAIEGDTIAYVGDSLPQRFAGAKVIELGSKALTPSFVDSHIHFASYATFHAGLNVMNAKSNAEILEMIRKFAAESNDKLLVAFGASPYSVYDGRLVTREELDSVCPDRPFFMVKYDGHACVVNSMLLDKVGPKAEGLRGFHPDSGEMNQEAFFKVSDYVTNSISIPKLISNMQKAADYMAGKGIGMIHSVSGVGFTGDLDVDMERFFARGLDNGMQMRVFFQTMDVNKAVRRKLKRIGGCFACALDGCFGSADAAMLEPYAGTDDRGVLYYTDDEVTDFCRKANRAGLQIEMHAIGDAAFDQATRALKTALDEYPREDHRHGIIHDCLPTQHGLEICRDYHILMPVQSAFIDWPQEPDEYLEKLMGPERSSRLNPLRDFQDAGIVLSAGSDGPCTDPDPIEWMYRACNHSNPAQSLTVAEALKMCTYNGYYTTFDEDKRGSLEEGKIADMAVLSGNPYETKPEDLRSLSVKKLILSGHSYRPVKSSGIMQVLKGAAGRKYKQ
ncbi:MAG: amidohydrolase family protein [Lachnospiraceae bacterium]|nr:amidohydrolase family protein [Lachnospiraceae bacterium]